nr:peptidyl-prolyl cis-trans isomerase CYP40 [Tanacetum cinerariifolium]
MALRKYKKAVRYLDVCWEKEGIDDGQSISMEKKKALMFTNSAWVCLAKWVGAGARARVGDEARLGFIL